MEHREPQESFLASGTWYIEQPHVLDKAPEMTSQDLGSTARFPAWWLSLTVFALNESSMGIERVEAKDHLNVPIYKCEKTIYKCEKCNRHKIQSVDCVLCQRSKCSMVM